MDEFDRDYHSGMNRSLLQSILFFDLCGQAWAQVQPQMQDAEEHERTRREMRSLPDETARARRALAVEWGPELVPTSKGSER
jgi:hypothetical protein